MSAQFSNEWLQRHHIIKSLPFRIREIRTDNGHQFQAKFHWQVEGYGIRHAYIKRATPQLNGKIERSHRSDQTGILPVAQLQRRRRSGGKTQRVGTLQQLRQTTRRLQRKDALRGAS
jgi:transposase InsO family protein